MITHTKTLLFKVNSLREELEAFDEDNDELADVDDLLDAFREFQRAIPLTFFSQYPLDNQYITFHTGWPARSCYDSRRR
jgi:hypothetical protein